MTSSTKKLRFFAFLPLIAFFFLQFSSTALAATDGNVTNSTTLNITGVNSTSDYNFSLGLTLRNYGSEIMAFANISFVNVTWFDNSLNSNWTIQPSMQECGNISVGNACAKTFYVIIPAGSGNRSNIARIYWNGTWNHSDMSGFAYTIGNNTRMSIAPNPAHTFNITALNSTLSPRVSNITAINLTSAGNYGTNNVTVAAVQGDGGTINTSWVQITNNNTASISANNSVLVTVNITPTVGTTAGQYNGYLNATSNEGAYMQIPLNITVQSNGTWSHELSTTYNKSFGISENGSIVSFYINNTGNLLMNFTVNCTSVSDECTRVVPGNNVSTGINGINITIAAQSFALVNVTLATEFSEAGVKNFTLSIYPNESVGEPASNSTLFYINVTDTAPVIRALSVNASYAEVNQAFQFDAFIQDDLGVSNQSVFFNITFPNGTVRNYSPTNQVVQQAGNQTGDNRLAHYFLDFNNTATQGNNYSVVVSVWDNAGQNNASNTTASRQNFSVVGDTNVSVSLNSTTITTGNISNSSSQSFAFLITLNNTGNATAYALNLSVTNATSISASAWNYSVANVSNFSSRDNATSQLNFSIASQTAPSVYNFTINASWRQANGSLAFNTSTISINVTSNKSMNLSDYTADYLVVIPGTNAQANFTINNLGNANITSANLSCSGSYCETFNVGFNVSQVQNLTGGNSTAAHFNVSVPSGTTTGYYIVTINATTDDVNASFSITVQVPDHKSWTVSDPQSRTLSLSDIASQSNSNSQVRVRNFGNVNMSFNFTLSGNITSFMSINGSNSSNTSNATLGAYNYSNNATNVTLNWTTPNATATYTGNLTITNGTDETNISITFNAFILTLNITYPLPSNQASNLTAGQNIPINATIVLGTTNITTNSTFNATLSNATSSQLCPVTNASVVGNVWTMNCTVPSTLLDGKTYNLTLSLNYSSGTANVSTNATSLNSAKYRDTTSPSISNSSTPNIEWGNGTNNTIQANWTDNDALQWVNVTVFYPNNSILFQSNLSSANASFPNVSLNLSAAQIFAVGDYKVTFNASDLSNNTNNTHLFFEVINATAISGTATDAGGTALTVNYSFYRFGTNTSLVANGTNSSGSFSLRLNRREYDANITINTSTYTILLKNASINASTTAIATLDIVPVTGISVTGAKVLQALAANTLVPYTNATIIINYTQSLSTLQAYGYSQEYLFLFKCSNWNITSRSCSGNFTLVSNTTNSSTNKALDTVFNATTSLYTVNISSFSAYALVAGRAGDGVCRADLGENCVVSTDCTCEINATGTNTTIVNTVYVSSGGGGGGVSNEPQLVEELTRLREQNKKLSNITKDEVDNLTKRLSALENRTQLDDQTIAELQAALNRTKSELGISTAAQNIYLELYGNEVTQASVHVRNPRGAPSTISARAIGAVEELVQFDQSSISLDAGAEADFKIAVSVPAGMRPGSYSGEIELTQENVSARVPISIRVLESKERLIDIKIQPLSEVVAPGRTLRTEINVYNLGESKRIDANLKIQLVDPASETILQEVEDQLLVETTISTIKSLEIPANTKDGKFLVRAIASYASTANRTREASSLAYFRVERSIWDVMIFGRVPVWFITFILLAIVLVTGFYYYAKNEAERKKRYLEKIDFTKLPAPGARSGFIGKIAETSVGAFVELDRLTMHALIAGATGSGKTVAAQVLIEEALRKGIAVVVFDPTAQWTGFLRAQRNKEMLAQYKDYNMSPSEAQAFKGNIHVVKDPNEQIDVKKLIKPGEITVFALNKLKQTSEPVELSKTPGEKSAKEAMPEQIDFMIEHLKTEEAKSPLQKTSATASGAGAIAPSQIELFVANTVNRVFESNLEETKQLRLILVYDEVHRLLPKFGGSGLGFTQIERAVREFRKWGVGLVLISQVLSDFVGEIKANIGTEVQMRTKYEEDLERIKQKYGEETLKSVVRAGVGVGMTQNSEYNRGAPYFVSFRPLLHNVVRLSDQELADYEAYNEKIESFAQTASSLKAQGTDVFDIELELDLARDKLKKGAFNIVDIYMESIQQKLNKMKK